MSDGQTTPTAVLAQPPKSPPASQDELLAHEEYARILYEKFKLKIQAQSRASASSSPPESRERMKWLKGAARNALAIYRSAKKARVDFEFSHGTARADVEKSRLAS